MTSRWPNPVPDEEAFAAIKAGVDALPPGTKQFLNSGWFISLPASPVLIDEHAVSRVLWTWSFHWES